VIVALALACARPDGGLAPPTRGVEYAKVHRAWTQELMLDHDFELDLVVRASLLSDDLRRAQADALADARLESETARLARHEAWQADRGAWVVVFAAHSPHEDARRFGLDDDDPWQLRLLADGQVVEGVGVDRVRKPSADQVVMYPQLDRWSTLWEARFVRAAATELSLQVVGPHGRGELTWDL